jgi:hypothetical protein
MDAINLKIVLVRQKYISFEKQKCFFYLKWETKNDKKFEFEQFKIPNLGIWSFWEIFKFSNSNFFCHFWFPIKKIFVSQSKYTFVLPKQFLR